MHQQTNNPNENIRFTLRETAQSLAVGGALAILGALLILGRKERGQFAGNEQFLLPSLNAAQNILPATSLTSTATSNPVAKLKFPAAQ